MTASLNGCLRAADVAAFVLGELPAAAQATLEGHVDSCAACRALLADLLRDGGADAASARGLDDLAGTQLGRFTLGVRLGSGAMGVVYAAHDAQLRRDVAIKLLRGSDRGRPGPSAGETVRTNAHVINEARALAALAHRNIVAIHDVGMIDGLCFIVMEHVAGETLTQWTTSHHGTAARRAVLAQVAHGLAHAHDAGVIHRDVKPANVLVAGDRAVVVDFGIAAATAEAAAAAGQIGTPAYMAPEARRGEALDARSDVFSFATMAYECLEGRRPESIAPGTPPPPRRTMSRRVHRALVEALAPDRAQRRPTMRALAAALAPPPRRWPLVLALGVVAVAVAATWWLRRPTPPAASAHARCSAALEPRVAALWNPGRAAMLQTAFVATGLPYAEHAAREVAQHVTTWTAAWRDQLVDRCTMETGAAPMQPPPIGSVDHCLAQLGEAAEHQLTRFARPTRHAVEHAVADAYALPVPASCVQRPTALAEVWAWNAADPVLVQAQALRDHIAAGDLERAAAQAATFDRDRAWTGHPARAQIELALGVALARLGADPSAAAAHLAEAAQLADAHRHDYLRAEANLELAKFFITQQPDAEAASRHLAQADVAIARSGHPPELARRVQAAHADERLNVGDDLGAIEILDRLVAIERELPPSPLRAMHLDTLGYALLDRDPRRAVTSFEASLAMFDALLGPHHPDGAIALMGRAHALGRLGDVEAGIVAMRAALTRALLSLAETHPLVLEIRSNLAGQLAAAGRAPEAVEMLATIEGIEAARLRPDDCASAQRLAEAQISLGAALANAGRDRDGVAKLDAGLAAYARCDVGGERLALALYFQGSARAKVDGAAAGVPALERAVALLADAGGEVRAAPLYMLAQLTAERAPRRAQGLARDAAAIYRASGNAASADEIDAWLRTLPPK